jgi:tetratricopeptide (TPR) repeat protein
MSGTYLSRFSPELMDEEALESTFVQRDELAREILDRIRQNAGKPVTDHTLLVGSRGTGKSHLLGVLRNRVKRDPQLAEKHLVISLPEGPSPVKSHFDLIFQALRAVVTSLGDPALAKWVESLGSLPAQQAEREAATILGGLVKQRTLLVFMENADSIFSDMGESGQARFLEYLRENPFWMFVATAESVWSGLLRNGAPLSKFFRAHLLEGLLVEDISQLLSRIAEHLKDRKLAAFLETPVGRSRVRALKYLSGGNHRVCVIFSEFITRESLGDLIDPLVSTIDELTPYYESLLGSLQVEQRKILEWLSERRSAATAQEVASHCFIAPVSALAQLEALKVTGYVRSLVVEREKYYEVREPLMRLAIDVIKNRGEPVRLLVEFLGLWYSPGELKQRLATLPQDVRLDRGYFLPALVLAASGQEDPRIVICSQDYNDAVSRGDFARALRAVEELTMFRQNAQDWFARAICLVRLGNASQALTASAKVIELDPSDGRAWALRASLLDSLGNHQMAVSACETAMKVAPNAPDVYVTHAEILEGEGRWEEALKAYHRALKIDPENAAAHFGCGVSLSSLGRFEEALGFLQAAKKRHPGYARVLVYESAALMELKRLNEALSAADQAIAIAASDPLGWVVRGSALATLSRREDALEAFRRAIYLGDDSPFVYFKEAEMLLSLQRWRDGAIALDAALQRFSHAAPPDAGNTAWIVRNLMKLLPETGQLRLAVRMIVLVYTRSDVLRPLAQGIVESIPAVMELPVETIRLWRDVWSEWSTENDFAIALRLLDTAVKYAETRDPRVLLELPREERLTLEPLLDVRALETA